jgi:hypothetical protein
MKKALYFLASVIFSMPSLVHAEDTLPSRYDTGGITAMFNIVVPTVYHMQLQGLSDGEKVNKLEIDPTGKFIVGSVWRAGYDDSLKLWNMSDGGLLATGKESYSNAKTITFKGDRILVHLENKCLSFSGTDLAYEGKSSSSALETSSNGLKLEAVNSKEGNVTIYAADGTRLFEIKRHRANVKQAVRSPDHRYVATLTDSNSSTHNVALWTNSGEPLDEFSISGFPDELKFNSNSTAILVVPAYNPVVILNREGYDVTNYDTDKHLNHYDYLYAVVKNKNGTFDEFLTNLGYTFKLTDMQEIKAIEEKIFQSFSEPQRTILTNKTKRYLYKN